MNTPYQQPDILPHAMICANCLYEEFRKPLGTGSYEICPVCGKEQFGTIIALELAQWIIFLQARRVFNQRN